jgi:hypothetical protein
MVSSDATTVLHLSFFSPAPAVVHAPEPTVAPIVAEVAAPQPVATLAPQPTTAPAQPVALPADLPTTSTEELMPSSLPDTAFGGAGLSLGMVLAGGLMLGVGVLLQARPRRRPSRAQADTNTLRRLLASPPDSDRQ